MYYHRGYSVQRGRGVGAILQGLYRSVVPIAKKGVNIGKRILKSEYLKNLANKSIDVGKDALMEIASDVLTGEKTLKDSSKTHLSRAKKRVAEALVGRGCKRSKKNQRKKKNLALLDTFNLLK